MLVIGLTGGIACGKSAAARIFEQLGATVIDADVIARDLTQAGTEATQAIIDHFGPEVSNKQGGLDRSALAEIIFSNPSEREWLEQQLHPTIRTQMAAAINEATGPYTICVIPLLTPQHPLINRILVIDAPINQQLERLQLRDGLNLTQAQSRLQAQSSREERLAMADDIIINDGEHKKLVQAVHHQHQRYLTMML